MEDALVLIEAQCVRQLTNGWHIAIRAKFVDVSPARPWGVDYGLVLMNGKQRLLGFDNRHAYDDAPADARWDHEHRAGVPGQAFRYDAEDAWSLMNAFWDRFDDYLKAHFDHTGEVLKFLEEGGSA